MISSFERYRKLSRLTPYQRWELSNTKEDIVINLEYGMEEIDRLGVIHMDIDAPCDICRQYIERTFRKVLNEHCGKSFKFYIRKERGEEEMLEVEQEELKWSKDFITTKFDETLQKDLPTITIVVIAGEDKVLIEEAYDELEGLLSDDLIPNSNDNDEDNDGFTEM